jgi:hypothetical protein
VLRLLVFVQASFEEEELVSLAKGLDLGQP